MSYFVYISHRDPVEAILAARHLMQSGYFPFVPSLNKLVAGKTDEQWQNYYKNWMFRCDCVLLTETFRTHEKQWAMEIKLPICSSVEQVFQLLLPPFAELGRKFGEACALHLDKKEDWRKYNKEEALKQFHNLCGLGAKPLEIGVCALQAWDRETNG